MKNILAELKIETLNPGCKCGEQWLGSSSEKITSHSPVDGTAIAQVQFASKADYEKTVQNSLSVFEKWRMYPAPKRGELIRQIGNKLREKKAALGKLVTLEMGKILVEGEGEVQEMIDIADFAVGLSRSITGLTMHSERPKHRMYEQWHPLGPVGVISAFNFPVAVWSWNAFLAAVCGDTVIWKPSFKTPLTAIAVQHIVDEVMIPAGFAGVFNLVIGSNDEVGEPMLADRRVPLVSATGSCRMGRRVAEVVGKRLGKTLLELGGNNAIIVAKDANLNLATQAIAFGAMGTAGQRCTSTRRVFAEKEIFNQLTENVLKIYKQIPIGNPLDRKNLMGPVIDQDAVKMMQQALVKIQEQGGEILRGGKVLSGANFPGGCYVEPTVVKVNKHIEMMNDEVFAPILYLMPIDSVDEAIKLNNQVSQGLSSSVFTTSFITAETFLSHAGSDCGIANVNIGTSGAEIGGAFGGEKDTGGGRESGSDSWKAYMRRQTCTLNWGSDLPLAQGIKFDL